jgi:hypothetical protein
VNYWRVAFVNDTSPEIALMVRERYAQMQPVERFLVGVRMFETARAMVLCSFPSGLSPLEQRRRLCERLYPGLAADAYGIREGEET